jgi:hypothetical protein
MSFQKKNSQKMANSLPIGSLNLHTPNENHPPKFPTTNENASSDGASHGLATNGNASAVLPINRNASLNCGTNEMRLEDQPRMGYIDWDEYFMAVSFLSAQRSKDPATQVRYCAGFVRQKGRRRCHLLIKQKVACYSVFLSK